MPNKRKQDSGIGSLALGTLLGSVAGAILAFWLAPRSGQETRDQIGDNIERTTQSISDTAQHVTGTAKDTLQSIGDKVEQTAQSISDTAQDVRRKVTGDSVEDSLREAKEEARRLNELA